MDKERLNLMRYRIACEVMSRFEVPEIRRRSLENLARWRNQGTWSQAYEEWLRILSTHDDLALKAVIIGADERSVQLRQSMPYVGMLDQRIVRSIHEK